ncbi:hypothetical protein [Neoroseomonas soli]|uniref:RepB-like DNA primase domain-containing protein n=1 Tax=Neoroseomonas soli TaxID=1081025 RepID=A0A9X9WX39_9PROT|nr:hypothetical protein [Neoroseomonas soli]MBR0671718.1 hypothetical protein [Neoroseomonas soli]
MFGPGEEAALRAWADGLGERDTYTLVGLPEEGVAGQPTKEQMRGAEVLWVDLDPRAGEEVTKERERMLALLTTARPTTLPPPSLIVDSGRGLWAFWRLAAPLHDAGLVERLKGMRSGAVEHLKSFLSRSVDRARMAAPVACACSRRTRRSSWRR